MRITVVSPHLPSPALPMRGMTHDEQLRLFAEAGHTVRAVVPLAWSPRRHVPDEQDGAIPILHPRYLRPPGRAVERRLFARAAAAALGTPDVVLAHSATLPGGLLRHLGRTPFVVTIHDHELYELAPRSALVKAAIARTLRRADRVVYVSEALRREGLQIAGPHAHTVIPIAIVPCPGVAAEPPAVFTISTVTRLIARKRVDRLIRVFARLAAELPGTRLIVVGDGPERQALVEQALGLRVEFTGALPACRARAVIARSNVMALPSVLESLGAVYLEAMSLGVPALATRGEGIEEHVEHGASAILVPAGDDDALLAALRALAADPARARRIGEAGRRRFLAGPFTPRANADAYLALFDELIARATHTV